MQNLKLQFKNKKNGFTLVELIVSLGLFTIVVMIATGAMLSLSDTNRKVKTMRIAMDNLNLALESMSREIRMGSVYTCNPNLSSPPINLSLGDAGVDCTGGDSSLAFLSKDDSTTWAYRLNGSVVQQSKNGGSGFSDITAVNIVIDELRFYVRGAETGTGVGSEINHPYIVISLAGTVSNKSSTSFRIQTTVTQRSPE